MSSTNKKKSRRPAGPSSAWRLLPLLAAAAPALAQAADDAGSAVNTRQPETTQSAQSAQTAQYDFDIPPQPLASALTLFGRQSGLQLAADTEFVSGLRTQGLKGRYTADQALRQLLAGTGLTYEVTDPGSITLRTAQERGVMRLDPIVIAGEKVERRYLDTYTSVGVATQADIETYSLDDLPDAFNTMANVRAFSNNRGNNGFEIRGMNADGVTQPANSAPLISVIVDGTTQSAEGLKRGSRGTWDVKQVEVLRGPQSTLQGRNALAGAVVVKTNDPTWEPELALKGVIGSYDRREGAVALSAPIVPDEMSFRLASEYREQTKDIDFADEANEILADDEYFNLRGKLLFVPKFADGLRVLLTGSHTYDQPSANAVSGPDFFDRELNSASTFTEFREMKVDNINADASYAFADKITLRSVTAVNKTDLKIFSAPSSTNFVRDDHRRDSDVMQELRLEVGNEIKGLSGVVGLFYGDFEQEIDSFIEAGGAVFQNGVFRNETDTKSVYADLRYRVFERVSLIGGGRYQHDTVRNFIDIDSDFGPTFSDRETTFDVFLPKFGVAFDISRTQTIAATATRGYRQGFTEVVAGSGDQVNAVKPEFMWTYELAYRLAALENRLNLGLNVFYNDYKDQQVTITDPVFAPLANTRNAGGSKSYGAEIEGRYDFRNGIEIFGALGLLKTEFGDFEDAACAPSGGNCEGNSYPEAPAVTAALGGAYRHSSGLFAAANASYTDEYYAQNDINNRSQFEIGSRVLVNAKAGYQMKNVTASVFVDNLLDKQYLTGRSITGTGNEASIGDGRTVGVEVRMLFR